MRGRRDTPDIRAVSHDYLQAMGVRLVAGRWFEARDDVSAPPVIIVIVLNRYGHATVVNSENPLWQMVLLDSRATFWDFADGGAAKPGAVVRT